MNALLGRNRSRGSIVKIVNDGAELTGHALANAFNEHFISIADKTNTVNSSLFRDTRNNNSIFLEPVVDAELISVVLQLKNSGSCDADGIQIRPVKHVVHALAPVLTHIFNLCITTGVFPKRMQIAKVSVLHKKGSVNDMGNYRPISILPVFSKILEKLLHIRLINFSNKYNLITASQFGFIKQKSTESALLVQKEHILQSFEEKKLVLGVFVDFTKAFDCLSHKILIEKLDTYGIRGHALKLIKSYLADRMQFVCIDGHSSTTKPIISGVPQGSILGPFLFNIFVNDIVNITSEAKFVNYADDTTLLFTAENVDLLFESANLALSKLNVWSRINSLQINVAKTKAVLFRPKSKLVNITKHIVINSTRIEIVNAFKLLGVTFSENMSWDDHINYVTSKLSQIVGILNRNRYVLPTNVKLLIYNSLFYSHLIYGHLVWGKTTIANLDKINILQKKAVRAIANVDFDHPTANLFKKFHIISIYSLYDYRLSTTLKVEEIRNTSFLVSLGRLSQYVHPYPTRSASCWEVVTPRTNYGTQMLRYTIPKLLNLFPEKNFDWEKLSVKDIRTLLFDVDRVHKSFSPVFY